MIFGFRAKPPEVENCPEINVKNNLRTWGLEENSVAHYDRSVIQSAFLRIHDVISTGAEGFAI